MVFRPTLQATVKYLVKKYFQLLEQDKQMSHLTAKDILDQSSISSNPALKIEHFHIFLTLRISQLSISRKLKLSFYEKLHQLLYTSIQLGVEYQIAKKYFGKPHSIYS